MHGDLPECLRTQVLLDVVNSDILCDFTVWEQQVHPPITQTNDPYRRQERTSITVSHDTCTCFRVHTIDGSKNRIGMFFFWHLTGKILHIEKTWTTVMCTIHKHVHITVFGFPLSNSHIAWATTRSARMCQRHSKIHHKISKNTFLWKHSSHSAASNVSRNIQLLNSHQELNTYM